jgi:hypothetical protein
METINGFDFFRLHFDADGNLEQRQELEDCKRRAAQATDAIFIAHGFRNDENDATGLYTRFLGTFRQHVGGPLKTGLGPRNFFVAGVFWPSKAFPEDVKFDGSAAGIEDEITEKDQARAMLEEMRDTLARVEQKPGIDRAIALLDQVKDNPSAQNELVQNVLSLLDGGEPDPTEGVDNVRAKSGAELLALLGAPIRNPVTPSGESEGGALGLEEVFVPGEDGGETQSLGSFFGSIFGRIGQFLNLTTWYVMKNRSGVVAQTESPRRCARLNNPRLRSRSTWLDTVWAGALWRVARSRWPRTRGCNRTR